MKGSCNWQSDVTSAGGLPDVPVSDPFGASGPRVARPEPQQGSGAAARPPGAARRQEGWLPPRTAQGQAAADGGAAQRQGAAPRAGRQHRLLSPEERRARRHRRLQVRVRLKFSIMLQWAMPFTISKVHCRRSSSLYIQINLQQFAVTNFIILSL